MDELLSKFLDNYLSGTEQNTRILIALVIAIGINLIVFVANIVVQFKLKKEEKNIISFNFKEAKRIDILESIYNQIEKLTYFDGHNSKEEFIYEITELDTIMGSKRLYLSTEYINVIEQSSDYFKLVSFDKRKKDIQKEKELRNNYCKLFNDK